MEKVKNIFSNVINWVKSHLILLVAIIAAILVVVIVANLFIKTPKKVVKAYIKAFDKGNSSKIIKLSDFKAQDVLKYQSLKKFKKEDYKKFKEDYDNNDIEFDKDDLEELKDSLDDTFSNIKDNYKSYNIKVKKVKSVEKIAKDFYIVKVELSLSAKPKDKDDDKIDTTKTVSFAVYKNKLASGMSTMF